MCHNIAKLGPALSFPDISWTPTVTPVGCIGWSPHCRTSEWSVTCPGSRASRSESGIWTWVFAAPGRRSSLLLSGGRVAAGPQASEWHVCSPTALPLSARGSICLNSPLGDVAVAGSASVGPGSSSLSRLSAVSSRPSCPGGGLARTEPLEKFPLDHQLQPDVLGF